jgi:hypothetical protein
MPGARWQPPARLVAGIRHHDRDRRNDHHGQRCHDRRGGGRRSARPSKDSGSRLTGHQREVLVAIALSDVPIDVLAERLNTTRGALYKTLHDARRKLRAALAARGFDIDGDERGGEP